MKAEEILAANFVEALKLSQKTFYVGLLINTIAYLVIMDIIPAKEVTIPLLNAKIQSNKPILVSSIVLFFFSGLLSLIAARRASEIINLIQDKSIVQAVLTYPVFLMFSKPVPYLVLFLLSIFSSAVFMKLIGMNLFAALTLGILLAAPFGMAVVVGINIQDRYSKK